jgi:hypothetical protein
MNTFRWDSNQTFSNTEDGDMVNKVIPGSLIITSGVTVTTQYRCKGLHLQVMGNLYLYGTIDMGARGPIAASQNIGVELNSTTNAITLDGTNYSGLSGIRKFPSSVSAGVQTSLYSASDNYTYAIGTAGIAGIDGKCGSGGAGGVISCKASGNVNTQYSGPSTSFGGGPGSATVNGWYLPGTFGIAPGTNGGAGGIPEVGSEIQGGGAGNPGGGGSTAWAPAQNGTGGLLILIVMGYLYIHSSAYIRANGRDGGAASADSGVTLAFGGGGSGGGSILILYGSLTNNGTIQANGGLGGAQSTNTQGGNGGAGSIRLCSLKVT